MPTVSARIDRLLRFGELTADVETAVGSRAGSLLESVILYRTACDPAYVADVGDAPDAVFTWADSHRRLGEWTHQVATAFFVAETGPACVVTERAPSGITTVATTDVHAPADPEHEPGLIGPVPSRRPAILDALPESIATDDAVPLWRRVLDGAARPETAALIDMAALPPRGDHAVAPVRRIAVTRWLGNAATGFDLADTAVDGFAATRGRPTLDRLEVAATGVSVAGSVTLAGTAISAARCGPNLWCLGGVALATGFAASGAADWAMDVAAAGSRRETPDGHDLDALREEIADDDPDDVLIATAELAGAEQALLVSAADPELGAQIEALTGPIEDLEADLTEAGDPDG